MLIAIAILTLIDIACTYYGITSGYIAEGNPIASMLFGWSPIGTCLIVAALVGLLLYVIAKQYKRYRWIRYAMLGVLAVKIGIVGLHMIWISYI